MAGLVHLGVVVSLSFLFIACGERRLPNEPFQCATEPGAPAQIRGMVVTDDGSPISDAHVRIANENATTDPAGEFSILTLSGNPPLQIEASGYRSAFGEIVVVAGSNTLRAVLPSNSVGNMILFGRVLEACSGRPIAGARVGLPGSFATTRSDGTYVLSEGWLGNTTFHFQIEREGYKRIGPHAFRVFGTPGVHDFLMERDR